MILEGPKFEIYVEKGIQDEGSSKTSFKLTMHMINNQKYYWKLKIK